MIIKRAALVFLFALLSGCGHYGPLFLPQGEQKAQKQVKKIHIVKKES